MAFSVNEVTLLGNLGKDIEVRETNSGLEVGGFSVATTYGKKVKEEWTNETTWHNVVLFKPNDFLKNSLVKGSKVFIKGRIQNRSYEKDGDTKYISEVVASQVIPLDKSENREASGVVTMSKQVVDPLPF